MKQERPFHHGNLRQALVDAATELLDTKGVTGTTLRAVASLAGVSHAAPANHFKDRRALLTEVAATEFAHLWASLENGLKDSGLTGTDRVTYFAETIIRYAMRHPHRYELLWRSELVDHQDTELLCVMDKIYDALCSEILRLTRNSEFDVNTYAISIWSMTHGYVALRLSGMFEEREDEIRREPRFDAMMKLLTGSLHPSGKPARSPAMRRGKKARGRN